MKFVKATPFAEAVRKLDRRLVVGAGLTTAEWSPLPLALRERAFWSATILDERFLQDTKDHLTDFLTGAREDVTTPDGRKTTALRVGSRGQFIERARKLALSYGIDVDPQDKGGLKDITSETRLGLIFDVQTQSAFEFGNWKQGMDPDVLNEFPAWRFIREVDVKKPRPVHQQNEGVVRLKTDLDFWMAMNSPSFGGFGMPHGPWGFNSGMGTSDVDRTEAESLGLVKPGQVIPSAEQDFNDRLKASVRGLDPDRIDELKRKLGDRLVFEGDTARWRSDRPLTPPAAPPASQPEPAPPAPSPAAPANVQEPPLRKSPVSARITPKVSGALKTQIQTALHEIDRVHDDGDLPKIDIKPSKRSSYGYFSHLPSGVADHIGLRRSSPWPELTTVHEVGHMLDLEAIGTKGEFATIQGHKLMTDVLAAARDTKAIRSIQAHLASASGRTLRRLEYFLDPKEIWARAYAQFVAERSGSPILQKQLRSALAAEKNRQWESEDFAGVAAAIEKMFTDLGWL